MRDLPEHTKNLIALRDIMWERATERTYKQNQIGRRYKQNQIGNPAWIADEDWDSCWNARLHVGMDARTHRVAATDRFALFHPRAFEGNSPALSRATGKHPYYARVPPPRGARSV